MAGRSDGADPWRWLIHGSMEKYEGKNHALKKKKTWVFWWSFSLKPNPEWRLKSAGCSYGEVISALGRCPVPLIRDLIAQSKFFKTGPPFRPAAEGHVGRAKGRPFHDDPWWESGWFWGVDAGRHVGLSENEWKTPNSNGLSGWCLFLGGR